MDKIIKAHKAEYGVKPDAVASAPGRFHLCGEHTWFFRDKTLSMAVNLPVYVAASRNSDSTLKINFIQVDEKKKCHLSSLKYKKEDKWANSVKAIIFGFQACGFNLYGLDITISSDILPQAGFGISTAIKVACAWVVREVCALNCSDAQIFQVFNKANRQFLNVDNLAADYYATVYSKEDSFVLTDYATKSYDILPFNFKDKTILLTDASVPRIVTWNEESLLQPENVLLLGELKNRKSNVYGGWAYEEDSSEVNEVLSVASEETKHRLQCIMYEHKSVLDCVKAIKNEDFAWFARAVSKSHEHLRDLYEVSCPEIDWIIKRIQELDESPDDLRTPVNCGRITGKGFGRGVYSILRNQDIEKYNDRLREYERIFGFTANTYEVKPADGVHLL